MKTNLMTEQQWQKLDDKYKGLAHKVGYHISGDDILCTSEDLKADLDIIAVEAVATFAEKTNQTFDEFFESQSFDKYLKSCLWNYKANRGAKITKKKEVKNMLSIEELSNNDDFNSVSNSDTFIDGKTSFAVDTVVLVEDYFTQMTDYQKHLVSIVVNNPEIIKPNGTVNRLALASIENIPWRNIDKEINAISKILNTTL
jgi:hypothetical protein